MKANTLVFGCLTGIVIWHGCAVEKAHAAACLAISGLPSTVVELGQTLNLDAQCCAASSVPALPGPWLAALVALLAGLALRQRRRAWLSLLVLSGIWLLPRPAAGEACSANVTWTATSEFEQFEQSTSHFRFTPSKEGTFVVRLGSGSDSVTQVLEVRALTGRCCGSLPAKAATFGISVSVGASLDLGGCAALELQRTQVFGISCSPECSTVPASSPLAPEQDCIYGSRASDNPLIGRDLGDRIHGFSGDDTIFGNMGIDQVYGELGNDVLHGGRDNDCLHGGRGQDDLLGELGDDRIFGDRGDDILRGGDGNDTYVYDTHNSNTSCCQADGTTGCSTSEVVPDGNDELTNEPSGNDVVFFKSANRNEICLRPTGDDLAINYCAGTSVAGSVLVRDRNANHIDQVVVSGN